MPGLMHLINTSFQKATFGMGCFWACDALFGGTPGILRTKVGFAGGTTPGPKYKSIGDHTEVVELHFDPKVISFEELLELFWNNHEYSLSKRIKRQYMSMILYHDEEQKRLAEVSMKKEAHERKEQLMTEIASAGPFYPAEDYHQKYRLQQHAWICKELELTPELLQTSHVACRLNGYLAGVGCQKILEKDLIKLGLSEKLADFVRKQHKENSGGNLYCG